MICSQVFTCLGDGIRQEISALGCYLASGAVTGMPSAAHKFQAMVQPPAGLALAVYGDLLSCVRGRDRCQGRGGHGWCLVACPPDDAPRRVALLTPTLDAPGLGDQTNLIWSLVVVAGTERGLWLRGPPQETTISATV